MPGGWKHWSYRWSDQRIHSIPSPVDVVLCCGRRHSLSTTMPLQFLPAHRDGEVCKIHRPRSTEIASIPRDVLFLLRRSISSSVRVHSTRAFDLSVRSLFLSMTRTDNSYRASSEAIVSPRGRPRRSKHRFLYSSQRSSKKSNCSGSHSRPAILPLMLLGPV